MTPPLPEGELLLPLFPLPHVVFFPHTRLPRRIFEPRYGQMVQDVVEGGKRIGLALLRSGWEAEYFGPPPVHSSGTLATIEHSVPLEDGRINTVVRGDARFRILEEVFASP